MSNIAIANTVYIIGCVLVGLGFLVVHLRQRYQGRRPGQRWDRYLGKWVD